MFFTNYSPCCLISCWKKLERKRKNLIRLGVEQGQAYAWSRSRMGGWAIAQSPILGTTITVDRLKKRGYVSLLDIYNRISPQLNPEASGLYTRTRLVYTERCRSVQWCERCTGSDSSGSAAYSTMLRNLFVIMIFATINQ